jgi:hypothetical protein
LDTHSGYSGGTITGLWKVEGDCLAFTSMISNRHSGYQHTQAQALIQTTDADTVALLQTRELPTEIYEVLSGPGESYRGRIAARFFTGRPIVLVQRSFGIILSSGFEPELSHYNMQGQLIRRIRIEEEVEPVSGELTRAFESRLRAMRAEYARTSGREPQPLSDMNYADTVGCWEDGYWDDAGYMWLTDVKDNLLSDDRENTVFRIIDPDGRYLGRTEAPSGREFTVYNGHFLTVISNTDTGEQVPTIFRIVPSAEGLRYP